MSRKVVHCDSCETKNRIPSDRLDRKWKCGSCGHLLSVVLSDNDYCPICQEYSFTGVHLSNGTTVHESCLNELRSKEKNLEERIEAERNELRDIRKRISKQKGLPSRLKSILIGPQISTEQLSRSRSIIESRISDLSSQLDRVRGELRSIYDYFLTYPPDWGERRRLLIHSAGKRCSVCRTTSRLHVHHVIPLSRGGSHKLENLELLCETCHSGAHGGRDFSGEFTDDQTAFSKRVADISEAINYGNRIRFNYKKPTDSDFIKRTVHPRELINIDHRRGSGSTLCVRGYCELREDDRTFDLKRMRGLKVLNE